jgi:VIT1/CCC1 family predicted Fe2+/Mn2+ transporter
MGIAGATTDRHTILVGGVAGLVAGALSMAVGEYVSVSTQRDTERALVAKETRELREEPEAELAELIELYRRKGLEDHLARQVAVQLTEKDALRAHLDVELGIDPDHLASPWQAAAASFAPGLRVVVTVVAVTFALALAGVLSARAGDAPLRPAVSRVVVGGLLAMTVTYVIGSLVGRGMA